MPTSQEIDKLLKDLKCKYVPASEVYNVGIQAYYNGCVDTIDNLVDILTEFNKKYVDIELLQKMKELIKARAEKDNVRL